MLRYKNKHTIFEYQFKTSNNNQKIRNYENIKQHSRNY